MARWVATIQQTPAQDFWFWPGMLLLIACVTAYGIFYFIRRARLIEDTPTSKIRSAVQGYLELIGQSQSLGGQPLVSPLTGIPCVWYSYLIERKRGYGSRSRWRRVDSGISRQAFILRDDTGQCLINPEKAEVITSGKQVWYGHSAWPKAPARQHAGLLQSVVVSGNYRYTERRLHHGEPLYALGEFVTVRENDTQGSMQEALRATLRAWKQKPDILLQHFDADNNGEIDLQEWEKVRQAARKKVLREKLSKAAGSAVHTLGKPADGRPFILSVRSQRQMSRRYRYKAAACLVAFVLSGPLAIWMILVRLSG